MDRRRFLQLSALAAAAGTVLPRAAGRARAADGLLPVTVKTVHDRGDAVITRYQANLGSGDFGVAAPLGTRRGDGRQPGSRRAPRPRRRVRLRDGKLVSHDEFRAPTRRRRPE